MVSTVRDSVSPVAEALVHVEQFVIEMPLFLDGFLQ
jgi:hypothetical protein